MKAKVFLGVLGLLLAVGTPIAAELHVLPVVADNVPGRNNSLWDTEVRIFSLNPGEDLVVRRKWVCLEGGGFVDDPVTAPVWRLSDSAWHERYEPLPEEGRRIIFLDGRSLLRGAGRNIGAVALEIEGAAVVFSRISNVSDETFDQWLFEHAPFQLLGLGQLVRSEQTPFLAAAVFPWVTPGRATIHPATCTEENPCMWRNNVGLVNPSDSPFSIVLEVLAYNAVPFFDSLDPECPNVGEIGICPGAGGEAHQNEQEGWNELVLEIPAWGWTQVNNIDYRFFIPSPIPVGFDDPTVNAASALTLNLIPESDDRPYYAYLSQVFSGVHDRNDPAFMTPIPGRFRSIYDNPAKTDSGTVASSEKE